MDGFRKEAVGLPVMRRKVHQGHIVSGSLCFPFHAVVVRQQPSFVIRVDPVMCWTATVSAASQQQLLCNLRYWRPRRPAGRLDGLSPPVFFFFSMTVFNPSCPWRTSKSGSGRLMETSVVDRPRPATRFFFPSHLPNLHIWKEEWNEFCPCFLFIDVMNLWCCALK